MSNPFSGIISTDLKSLFTNMIDALLEDEALTVPCRFVYSGTKFTKCPNCKFNSLTGKSANTYQTGGPYPFTNGKICPFCNSEGKIADENDDDIIYLAVIWDQRKWLSVGQQVVNPQNSIQTICRMGLLNRIEKVKEIIVDTNIEKFVRHRFQRAGKSIPIGFGDNQYIVTIWERSG